MSENQPPTPSPGRFTAGNNANPQGRGRYPPEERHRRWQERTRKKLGRALPKAIDRVLKLIKDEKVEPKDFLKAFELVLRYTLPAPKPTDAPVALTFPEGATLTEKAAIVFESVSRGSLAPGAASQLLMGLASNANVVKIDEHGRRLAAIEAVLRPKLVGRGEA